MRLSWFDRFALAFSLLTIIACVLVSQNIFESIPHIEDEMAYTWQAKVIARGQISVPSPEQCPTCFLVPFVVDHNGIRFGKYPLGWPVVLSFGERLGARDWVNPILAGWSIWLLYRLGKKLFNEKTALLAAFLAASSPFLLMNSGSFLAHSWSLFLTLCLALAWLDTFDLQRRVPRWMTAGVAALSIGLLALTRPLTAVGVCLPFIIHAIWLLLRGDRNTRLTVLSIGALAGIITAIHFLWQYAVTGDAMLNPYLLWWPYDNIGFGPGIGLQAGGYKLDDALRNAKYGLYFGIHDLFGWASYSWIFLPVGFIAIWRNKRAWLITAIAPSLILAYGFYWVSSSLLGPRYYYETLPSLALLTAAGICWLASRRLPWLRWNKIPLVITTLLVTVLVTCNLFFYTPMRLDGLRGLYGVSRAAMEPFLSPQWQDRTPALIIVKPGKSWIGYGNLVDLTSPFMDSPFIFAWYSSPEENLAITRKFFKRTTYYYYTDTPNRLYLDPRTEGIQ
ncbi:MAG TPA: glycosyltransferase family 39 protein [Anaerolineaceae bacterium]|nr:glycosyltransferase family 39 protein [Anaerolineaceae bacterium]